MWRGHPRPRKTWGRQEWRPLLFISAESSGIEAARGRGRPRHIWLFCINPQIYVHGWPRIELTYRFGVDLVPIELRVDIVLSAWRVRGDGDSSNVLGDGFVPQSSMWWCAFSAS